MKPGRTAREGSNLGPAKSRTRLLAAFALRKVRDLVVTLALMSLLVFFLFYIIPGDPVTMILGTEASPAKRATLEDLLGLQEPAPRRYLQSVTGLFTDQNPSLSLRFQQPVRDLIGPRLALTCRMAFLAFGIVVLLVIPLGLGLALHRGSWLDRLLCGLGEFFMAVPGYFLGLVLILLFAFVFKSFTPGSYQGPEAGWGPHLASLALPCLALALPKLAQALLFFRTALAEAQDQDYVRTARSKGASRGRIVAFHLIRNALLPLVTSLGLILADLITGSLIVEQVFVLPGAGRLLLTAIEARDLPLAQALILSIATLVVVINVLVDLINAFIDPRLVSAASQAGRGEDAFNV
ncbi:MAG: ABC transporter permease [Eubacteriales bacterium]|nr:ABC transporter permease [Clostridiales bacterium]MDY5836619.1 ABC transporter permease [Eubacteriales bacterium]